MEPNGNKVFKDIISSPGSKKYRFCKSSFENEAPPSFSDLGLVELVCIYNELYELGKAPPVIDAAELQQDPE
ncbi:hypothetical protein PIB30_026365, partial [Stylosanthes scabra]|nr:hypothetical protein [Stylosanthes scabra]